MGENVQALFCFADKLTRKLHDVTTADVDKVKAAGWDEGAIF